MKTLILDCDRSLASIGGAPGVEAALGFAPVPITHGLADTRKVLAQLLQSAEVPVSTPFLDKVTETRYVPNQRAQDMGLECLVVDTASTLAEQEFEQALRRLNGRRQNNGQPGVDSLDQSTWGPYGNSLLKLWRTLAESHLTVVVTCHEAKKEQESGFTEYEPNIKGSSATKMLRFFDAVVFCEVAGTSTEPEYVWRVQASQSKPAKLRGLDLGTHVPQDLGALVRAFQAAGTPHPSILVLGESGSGKTTSLLTLASGGSTPIVS